MEGGVGRGKREEIKTALISSANSKEKGYPPFPEQGKKGGKNR